ncbi:phage portal protein [Micromonospora sp. NPDC048930]|uniref:phage portal protein n=1 Tax=Micromonospora sp. NPDC048930 TaxID=3364261 RepID=UPI00371A33E0
MSVFWGRRRRPADGELRGSFSNPPLPSPLETGPGGYAGAVNLTEAEASLQKIAMWSSVDLIASLVSELPIDVFRGVKKDRTHLRTPSYLLDPAGDGYGVQDWLDQLLRSWLLRGNANGKIVDRDRRESFPTQVALYHPDTVTGWRDLNSGLPTWRVNGREVDRENMWHRRCYPAPGQVMGLSPVAYHATTIGLGLTAERFGLQWFVDGAHPSAMLVNTEVEMKQSTARIAKQRFLAAVRGTREPVVFGKGWKYEQIQVNPNESQFLETNKYTEAQCARLYGPGMAEVLGYDTGSSLTYSTVEGRSRHLLVYALSKWINRAERALTGMLPRGQYVKLNRDALLQSTTLERYKAHSLALRDRWRTPNEVRDIEDVEGTIPGGDQPLPVGAARSNDPTKDGGGNEDQG